jgi:hypothetical protein
MNKALAHDMDLWPALGENRARAARIREES